MSAWIVSDRHIDHLVAATIHAELAAMPPDEIGRMLWRENLASVAALYPGDKDGDRPGPLDFRDKDADEYVWQEPKAIPAGQLKAAIGSYRYQSCEHPEWDESAAKALTDKILGGFKDVEMEADGWDVPSRAAEADAELEASL